MTVSVSLIQVSGTSGLLLAKRTASDALLFGLDLSTPQGMMTSTVTLFFSSSSGALLNSTVSIPRVSTDPTATTAMRVSVSGRRAVVITESGLFPFALSQPLVDSPCADCVLTVGGPVGSLPGFQGTVSSLQVYLDISF
jgi:hypothetical protein